VPSGIPSGMTKFSVTAVSLGSRLVAAVFQGLTLVHFSAQLNRFLWDGVCMQGAFRGVDEVSGGVRGC